MSRLHLTIAAVACGLAACTQPPATVEAAPAAAWKPADSPLLSRWAKDVDPAAPHPEYPRMQMRREAWVNLNGLWDYAVTALGAGKPGTWEGKILVPFPIESALSGVKRRIGKENHLWYHRTVAIPEAWAGQRVLLHFGAVDWEAVVFVNGKEIGTHRGGYSPFTFDITGALKAGGAQELVVRVFDPSSSGRQARGKQVDKPRGIWYTPTSGIWRTAWIEPVPAPYIDALHIVPDIDAGKVRVTVKAGAGQGDVAVEAVVKDGGKEVARAKGTTAAPLAIDVPDAKLWSPDSPHLYDLRITLAGTKPDVVESYFGMRKSSMGKTGDGVLRMLLNNKFVFQYGPLDQGFWPGGLYTAPTDEALKYDLVMTKQLGFNMSRKHVKVEPDRWYYWCDKLGLLVWQDMPNPGLRPDRGRRGPIANQTVDDEQREGRKQFERELKEMVDAYRNHPCIVSWVPFNEGWGQYETPRIAAWMQQYDPTRLINEASGWHDCGSGDIKDMHKYRGPAMPQPEAKRAIVLGEFGGLGRPVKGHTWQAAKNWGYGGTIDTKEALTQTYVDLLLRLHPLVGRGLSAAVYTQTTDVEIEVNGLMTYDRAMVKMDIEAIRAAARKLYEPAPILKPLVPTSEAAPQTWRYVTAKPADGWEKPGFDDAAWKEGPGGFGTKDTPGTVVRTVWETQDIWIRRTFELEAAPTGLVELKIHHDEDAEVYLNGVPAAQLKRFKTGYEAMPMAREAVAALKAGKNVLAVHCKQTVGGQYIDVGLVEVVPAKK
jgi:hypothetical protein